MKNQSSGFTIVELLIVVVVIAILAAITIVSYNGITERARFASMRSDLASINKAIQMYHADNGTYPITPTTLGTVCVEGWCGWDQATGENFIPGLTPKYASATPQLPESNTSSNTYLYRSVNGVDYKLIRLVGSGSGLPTSERSAMADLMTSNCGTGVDTNRWGYWSSSVSRCW